MNPDGKNDQLVKLYSTLGKMEIALGTISDAIVWVGQNGSIQWCNTTFDRLVKQAHINVIGKSIYSVLPVGKYSQLLTIENHPFQKCLAERTRIKGKFDFLKFQEKKILEIICSYVEVSKQEEVAISVIRDITTKEELEKYRLLNAAVMKAANAIAITDSHGRIIWTNPSFSKLTGYSEDEIYFETFQNLKSGQNSPELYTDLWKTILEGLVWEGRLINKRKDGSTYIEQQTISPVRNFSGQVTHFIAIKQDVTEAEETKAEMEKLSLVASKTDNAVIITDHEGLIEWVNDGFTKITGYRIEEVMGKKPGTLLQGPETSLETIRRMQKKFATRKGFSEQLINYHKDGHPYWLQITVTPVYDEKGELSRFVAVESDITKQKQVEETLRKYQDQLEEMVEERTHKLNEAQEELIARSMESGRAQLAAMILHNIGNAVTPFQSMIEQSASLFSPQLKEYIVNCYSELENNRKDLNHFVLNTTRGGQIFDYMGELIHTFQKSHGTFNENLKKMKIALDYISEILTMHQVYEPRDASSQELVQPNELLENALNMQLLAFEKRDIVINKNLAKEIPKLKIDKNRLMQVVINILKNAYEAIDMVKDINVKEISVQTALKGEQVVIEIMDNGIGIEPEKAEEIFEYGKSYKGSSGLGLHYCKMFLEKNGGSLKVSSKGRGRGSTFTLSLSI